MNRIYKVIWNEALSCFTAVGEYAKGRGKSSKSSVSANATINTTSNLSSTQFFRLSTIAIGMLAAGFTMSPQAFAQVNVGGGTGSGTAISSCNTNSTEANAEGSYSIAIGCEADAGQNFNLVDRGNPSFTWTGGSQNNSGSTAIGTGTEAGDVATALGTQAKAIGRSSVAIGAAAYSNGNTSLALGRQSAATADFAQAIGNVSSATGQGSLAVGHSALASGKRGIAIGSTDFENAGTVADQANVGYRANGQTQAVGSDTIAFGSNAKATADNSLAFGVGSRSNAVNGIALGANSIANRAGGASGFVPVGADSSVIQATDSVTLGAVSVGTGAAGGNRQIVNVAAGSSASDAVNVAQLTGLSNTVANNKTKYYSVDSAAVGNANNDGATGYNAMALGGNAKATGSQTIAIGSSEFGQQTMASGEQSIAIGANVVSRGASSIAIGGDDLDFASRTNIDGSPLSPLNSGTVNDVFKSYVGKDLVEINQYDVNTEAGGAASIAIGAKSLSKGDLSTAVGVHSNTSGTASSAFGVGASASKDGSVSLGAGSTTATSASSEKTMTVGGVVYDIAGNVIDDKGMLREGAQVSVGVVGSERQIKNVAGGAVTAASTDAVNGSQLYATNEAVGNNTTTINKGFALKAADGNTVQKPLGQAVEVVGSNSNIDTRVKNGKIEVELNDNLNLGTTGSVSTGNLLNGTTVNGLGIVTGGVLTGVTTVSGAGVTVTGGSIFNPTNATLTSNGLTILNGPSITKSGVNAGNKRVINVDDGVNAKDAVNFSQLETTNTNVTTNTNNISTNTTNIGTNTDNIAKGIKFNVNDASSGGTLKKTFALGEEIKFDTDSNLTTTGLSTGDGIKLGLANNLTGLDSASFNSGVSISSTGINAGDKVISGVASGGTTETNAANIGDLNSAITGVSTSGFALKAADGNTVQKPLGQAVEVVGSNSNIDTRVKNGKIEVELNDNLNLGTTGSVSTGNLLNGTTVNGLGIVTGGVLTGVTTVSGAGVTVTGGSIFNPTNATLTSNGLTILNGPSITKSGVNAGNKKVVNVSNGTVSLNSKDAINGGQLFNTNQQVTTNTSNISTNTTNIGTNTDNIAKGIKFNVNDASSGGTLKKTFALGEEIKFDTDSNLTTTGLSTGDGIKLGLANNLTGLDSASFNSGVSISSTGINAGDKVISGVASGGTTETNAANIGDVQMAAAGARTKVVKGTNVASVDFSTDSDTGQDVYTVNANGTSISTADANALTVSTSVKDPDTNITDYQVDLSEGSKASLVKADSAMQTVVTQINGADVKTLDKDNNTANFITGDNIVLTADNGGIKVATAADLVSTSLTTGTTVVNADGVTFMGGTNQTVRLSNSGLDNGGNQITNVANGTIASDAVNFGQLQATTTTIDKGFDFDGDTGTTVNRQLGDKLTIKGGATVESDLSNGNNIGVVADGTSTLTVKLAKDLTGLNSANFGSGVSISANGLNNGGNKITNVAEATTGKDAVNFDQLSATNSLVAKGIKIGDGNSANDQQFALGDTINVTGDSNITTMASATGVQVKLNNQLNLGNEGSMQIGNSIMNSNGFTFTDNGPGKTVRLSSSGLDNGFNRITNVAAGIADTDAATVGQLNATTFALDQGWGLTAQGDVATMIKQGSAIDLNSTDGNIKVSRSADNNVSPGLLAAAPLAGANDISFDLNPDLNLDSVTTGDTIMNNNGLTITGGPSVTKAGINAADTKITNVVNGDVSEGSKDAINGGQLYAQGSGISSIIGGETVYNPVDGTFTNSNIGGTGQHSIDGAIASIKQGEVVINENIQANTTNIQTNTTNIATNKTNIDTNTTNIKVNKDKIDAGLNFGADSGATINKPVGDGSVLTFTGGNNITTTAAGSSIKFDLNGNINIDSVKTGNTTINNNGVSIVGGPSMTASGINAAGNKITDVADGMAPRDAVNMGQLDAVSQRLGNNMNELGYKIGEVEDDANAGISAAMAMSSLPQAYIAGKSLIGGGIGTYNGESAVAIGFSKLSNDGRWVMKVNGTADTQGNAGGSIGAGFHFD
ncbi:YadA-like family protein [Psychrobacter sp. PG1]|uniref:YadA-like family protein n=3 Tax=unclassified Psychrobacter TaxID=196806 RepID=UPI001869111C|nr:YadA-like family protein [Psychrobacter sp. PG1]